MSEQPDCLAIDDLTPLQCSASEPVARPTTRVHRVYPLVENTGASHAEHRREIQRETLKHERSLERSEQRHRHALAETQRKRETWVLLAVLSLLIGSGVAWLVGWGVHDSAQIVFTTTFGGLAGYIGGQQRGASKRDCQCRA